MTQPQQTPLFDDAFLEQASIPVLQEQMEAGQLTSQQLALLYLDRIARYNKEGVAINAVLEVNPDALQIAEGLDAERAQQGSRGPLHGIPVLIKDNIDTADKMHTSAGSVALANSYAREDAFVARQLREAGAVILGKTNMTEWANFMTNGMTNGYSSRGGQVLNPYGSSFDVGGSSSGTGSAIGAILASVGVGTETSGSILSPSSQNSLVGIKPTVGLISRTGIIPISHSQDTAGPMTRTVTDAAILLGALAGVDAQDPATQASVGRAEKNYVKYLQADGLQGKRIGVPRDYYYAELRPGWAEIMERVIAELQAAGAVIVDPVVVPSAREGEGWEVLVYEFKPGLNAYLKNVRPEVPVRTLADVIRFNDEHADVALKFGQTVLQESEATSGTLTEAKYLAARARDLRLSQAEGIDAVMKEHALDALLFPQANGCEMAAKAGYPSITVPAGYTEAGEPLGMTLTARAYEEGKLIAMGYAYEQATKHRVAPKFE